MKTQKTSEGPVGSSASFAVGDWVKLNPDSEHEYEVAEIRRFPHGFMVGIYDEPPSKHLDFWNASSLTPARSPPSDCLETDWCIHDTHVVAGETVETAKPL